MPQAVIDPKKCDPSQCEAGRCSSRKACPVKAIWQEEPYSVPFLSGALCHACSKCLGCCPAGAIYLV